MGTNISFIVLISANTEWQVVRNCFPDCVMNSSPYGEWFLYKYEDIPCLLEPVIFIHGGWGKVAAAASTQYAITHWNPSMVINLGTCGGFEGEINRGEVILADKTIIYDIYEQMGDPDEHIKHYTTNINNSWISWPHPITVRRSLLVSGDRDLFGNEIPELKTKYNAIAGDWESGAIAWVSHKNHTKCLILRGVTDLVGGDGGEAYNGNVSFYYENTQAIMKKLVDSLPRWLVKYIECETDQDIKVENDQ
jgi:adenosylhomocysteine nucleosidase